MLHSRVALHWIGMRTWNRKRAKIGTLREGELGVDQHMQLSVIVKQQNGHSAHGGVVLLQHLRPEL